MRSVGNAVKDACDAIEGQVPVEQKVVVKAVPLVEAPVKAPPAHIWSNALIMGSAATKELISENPEIRFGGSILALKSAKYIYLIGTDEDELKKEGPEVLIDLQGGKLFILGEKQYEARLLKTIDR